MSEVQHLLSMSKKIAREALENHTKVLEEAGEILKTADAKSSAFLEAAQSICGHEYVTQVEWTEDGAYPNEPRFRRDCSICGKENV